MHSYNHKAQKCFFLFSMTDVTHTHTHVTILWKFSVRLRSVLVSFCDIFAWLITVWVWPSEANQRSSLICNRPIRDADGSANLSPVSTSMWTQNWFLLATRNPPRLLLLAGWGHKSLLCLGFLMVIRKPGRITLALVSKEGNQNRLTNYLRHSVSVPPLALAGWSRWVIFPLPAPPGAAQAECAAGAVWRKTNGFSIVHCNYFCRVLYLCWSVWSSEEKWSFKDNSPLSPFREWMLSFLKASLMCSTVWMESLEGWLGLKIIYFHWCVFWTP